jgi:Putative DNA-binding domain
VPFILIRLGRQAGDNPIGLADIERLIADRVPEGKDIEYKSVLPGGTDGEKKEFLADVSSFANTSGGDLVYGVAESQGIPERMTPLVMADADLEQRRFDSLIRDGIRPRLGYAIRLIDVPGGRIVVIRVERGWSGPYRVTFQGHDKFYGRTTAGKYPLDVDELRAAFTLSQITIDKIRAFRVDRTIALSNNVTPVPFEPGAKIVLHCMPFGAFGGSSAAYDVLQYKNNPQLLRPFRVGSSWHTRITLEGILSQSGNPAMSYTHLYRNGIVEAVEGRFLNAEYKGHRSLPSIAYEQEILAYLPVCFSFLNTLGVIPPIAVALTLTNVRGVEMSHDPLGFDDYHPVDVDTLSLPETVVENLDEDPAKILKPMFDLIWNACGRPSSLNFDAQGRWVQRR